MVAWLKFSLCQSHTSGHMGMHNIIMTPVVLGAIASSTYLAYLHQEKLVHHEDRRVNEWEIDDYVWLVIISAMFAVPAGMVGAGVGMGITTGIEKLMGK